VAGHSQEKYFRNKTLSQIESKKEDSQFWSGLIEVKILLKEIGRFNI
jgi:hypothetical protein